MTNFATVDEALSDIKKGKMLILVDHPKRENEGDFYIPTDFVNPSHLMTMIRLGGGLICCAITDAQRERLSLPLMVDPLENDEKTHISFTISVNAKEGVTTGVSAYDRNKTIKVLGNPNAKPTDLVRPGHVFSLVAKEAGVLERPGHTEAAVDLAKLAHLNPSGVICEIIKDDGHMAKLPGLISLSQKLRIKILPIDRLITYRRSNKNI
ncbi:3,4-dihydroxy-2-butanone-4-phosphate synthase [Candidatus Gottesmanbacteria bacterium]|nr:3,4-dihydroxy-2-butanone-4-phosphate synthase [Candidatus Gottesmanbacteria bacterium]